PVITRQPQSTNVVEGGVATFSVQLARTLGATWQWRSNGVDIPGANSPSYTFGPVRLADNGLRFRCFVTNNQGSTLSAEAVLTVFADTTRPALTSVVNLGDPQQITVLFSEPVELASATNRDNYAINQGVTVRSASLGDDLRSVILTTSPLTAGPTYTLTVNNVRDRAQTPNTILANSQRNFSLIFTPLDAARLRGPTEPPGPSSRRTGLTITEIMYHPAPRPDGRNLEFIELYNAQEWFEDISGWRLTGAIDYIFPSNTVMAARSYLVVAAVPADVQTAYNLTGVLGPWSGTLPNDSGTVRLRNHLGAVQLEVEYSGDAPYPAAADGAGHSLVLARPSLGERRAAAWAASDVVGGSPGRAESAGSNPFRTVFINEFLAHTDLPEVDFIELFNYSGSSVNVGGCVLTDDPATNKFVIPANTVIPARGFLAFDQTQLGFALSSAGETLYLFATNRLRVIDAVRFGGQANGVATGRFPDGAPAFHELATPTPGSNNSRRLLRDVVINEIHYNPISGDNDDEFIELHNRGTNAVSLDGWRLTDGIRFTFPDHAVLPAGGYVVVANNAMRLRTNYPGLTAANTFGDYGGTLANSGERIALTMPDQVIDTNEFGVVFTNVIHIVVDEVTYGTGGRWGRWADGGGSSLERIDTRADSRLPGTWADSDETTTSDWVTIEHTGVLDHGRDTADALQILLLGPGECLVDDVEVIPQGGANRVNNGGFTAGMSGWFAQGNQWRSGVDATGGIGGGPCLHLRASGRGDTGANRVRTTLSSPLMAGTVATIRARVRWLAGSPEILLRLRNGWLEATGNMLSTRASGTPGRRNSRAADNAAPAIVDVTHAPVLPAANASIQVSARVSDPDGLATLVLHYRLDPNTNFTAVSMSYSGAGYYSASIPGQPAGTLIAYYLEAHDNFAPRGSARFPADAPERECLIRVGDTVQSGNLGVYRVWMTQRTVDRWSAREKLSNDPLDCTFVYGGTRVVYNIGGQYGGSPYHAPGYNSPLGNHADYVLTFPKDDLLLNDEDVNLLAPGNGCCEGSLQREQQAYWTAYQLGLPFCYRRPVHVFFNGLRRGTMLMDDSQQPNGDMADQWYPEGEGGNLHKIQLWFEFDDNASGFSAGGASLGNFTTTGGQKKLARYRYNWAARAFNETANDYTNLFALMDATTTS
ncbi:MAG TPA: lamin tail domain-containing protein, partial [Methylomirabilota bacterium]|nr:lamin tail domain-containing protein [Methylomirabilota bacterium]